MVTFRAPSDTSILINIYLKMRRKSIETKEDNFYKMIKAAKDMKINSELLEQAIKSNDMSLYKYC